MSCLLSRRSRLLQLTLLVALGLFMSGAPSAYANTCNWALIGGGSWSTPANWGTCGGGYPGQTGPDTANITGLSLSATITVDVAVSYPVNLQISLLLLPVTLNVPSGSSLILDAASSATNTTINVNGGTLGVAPGATISSFGANVTLNSGTIDDRGSLTLAAASPFTFNGGTLSGPGTFGILGGGTANFAGNPLAINSGLTFNNAGTLNLTSDNLITTDNISNPGITNSGTLRKTGGTTLSQINCRVDNSGTVNANALEIYLAGGGTHTGTFTGSIVAFNGAHQLNSPATVNSLGALYLKGGTLLSNMANLTLPAMHHFDGTLQTAGSIMANGGYTWDAGIIDGLNATAPAPSLTVTSMGSMNITGSIGPTSIVNNMFVTPTSSSINYAGGSALTLANGGSIDLILSTFNVQDSGGFGILSSGSGTQIRIEASSSMTKSAASTSRIDPPVFNMAGTSTINVNAGALQINGGGSSAGAISNTTSLHFIGGTFAVTAGTLGGAGIYGLVSPATLTINTPETVQNFSEASGTLQVVAPNTFTISSNMVWDGGSITGGGIAKLTGTAAISAANMAYLDGGTTFEIAGTANYNANLVNYLDLLNASTIKIDSVPLGHLNINSGEIGVADTTSNVMNNSGVVTVNGAGIFSVAFNNLPGASLNVAGGRLDLENGGTSNAPFSVSSGATLAFPSGGYILGLGSVLNGAGTYYVTGTGFLNVNTPLAAPTTLNQDNGVLTGTADLTLGSGSTYNWTGGVMFSSTGNTVINGGSLLINTATNPVTLDTRAITFNSGTMRWTGTNTLTMKQGAAMNLFAPFDIQASGTLASDTFTGGTSTGRRRTNVLSTQTITVNAGGTLQKSTGGTMVVAADVTNNGGTIAVLGGGAVLALSGTATVTHTGTFNAASGILDFSGGTHNMSAPVSFTGSGLFKIHGATVNFNAPSTSMANLDLSSGTLGGTGSASTTTSFTWQGGAIASPVNVSVSTGTGTLNGAAGAMTLGGTLTVGPTATMTFNSANTITGGGSIVNNGTFLNSAAADIGVAFSNNSGGIYQYQPVATHAFNGPFTNAGNAQFTGGTENFTSTYTQTAGTTTLGPGNIGVTTLALNGGILNGNGTITGNVNNTAGSVNPGTSPGMITINGNYTQGASGILNIDLNGTTAGTTYDQLNVTGTATLAGTLKATLGYTPANNDAFTVLTFASPTGDFATYNLPPVVGPPPGTIQHTLGATSLQLLVAVPSADIAVTQTASPSSILHNQTATFSITVRNLGGSVATGISVNNTIVGGTFSSLSAPTCTPAAQNCTIPTLGPGGSETILLVVTGSAVGAMTNTALATTTSVIDPNLTNNSAVATVTVNGSADLSDTSSGPATVVAAQNASYTVTITNAGPDPATASAVFSVTGGTLVSATGAGFFCPTPASCGGAVILSGGNATLTVVAQAQSQAGTMVLTANVGPTASDSNTANNTASATTTVTASADVQVTKTSTSPLIAGATASYTIDVKNAGPSDAAAVSLSDPTPPGLTIVSVSGGGCTMFPCSLGTIAANNVVSITATYSVATSASGTVTNTATASTTSTPDPNTANNLSQVTGTVLQKADLSVTKAGAGMVTPGNNVTYTITVTNNGPSDALSVQLADPTPARLTPVSVSGACSAFPCSLGTMTPAQSKTIQAVYTVTAGPTTTIVNTATVSSATTDLISSNNSASASTATGCPTAAPSGLSPANNATNVAVSGTLSWGEANAGSYKIYLGLEGSGCSTLIANVGMLSIPYGGLNAGTTYEWRVEATSNSCPTFSSSCAKFTTAGSATTCPSTPPTLIAPINVNAGSSATFQWSAVSGATQYDLFVNDVKVATTTATTFGPLSVPTTAVTWYVVAQFGASCSPLQSQKATFNGCDTSAVPLPSLVGEAASGQGYDFSWTSPTGAAKFEVDESIDIFFGPSVTTTQSTTANSLHFQHTVTSPTAFYYRVRALLGCGSAFTANSVTMRVVLAPIVAPTNPNQSVQVGNKTLVAIPVHVPGLPGQSLPFTATLDNKPWLKSVQPASGILPPEGFDFVVLADPDGLPNGTFTGTLILLITTPGSGTISNNGVTPVGVPVSISLVTPVTPKPAGNPPANALIIPSVGHLDGINSHWQSDIRVANTSQLTARYQLTFSPDDAAKGVKQTIISVDAGVTTALDDIIKTWYGVGSLGESANGVLEIRPLDNPAKGGPANDDVSVSLSTVASSRTYNIASNSVAGTLGQFIPAIPFGSFIGKAVDASHAATVLGLQQIAQNDAYRTNVGVVEASGQPASVMISAFDSSGNKLLDFPLDLKGGEQRQLNSFLAQNKISLSDGRLEVKVTSGDGKVTAYASVVDNKSGDPLLVSGVPLGQNSFDHFVLPGVADLNTGFAAWRTDMRIFNPTTTPQFVTLNFYAQNSSAAPQMAAMTINPGEVKKLDNTMGSVFGLTNTGGAVHVMTGGPAPLVITGRTYNFTSNGTFGQFIPAVTSADAVGKGERGLQILQAEDSVRYRTNVGIAEVTGKPVTVEVQIILPDSKIAPSTQIPIPANGFVQMPVIQSLGLSNVYNARISLRVVDGDGRISAYGSVIDQITQDPTFVPAQK